MRSALWAAAPHRFLSLIRFAKRLAREARGAVLDAQTGETWPKSSGRKVDHPTRGVPTDTVQFHWYMLADEMPPNFPQLYLDLSRKLLPEALPRRYGTTEPLQGKLERDGDRGFIQAYESEPDSMLFMYCTHPVPYGYILGRFMHRHGGVRTVKLEMDRSALSDPPWRDAAHRFFIKFAEQSSSFFASAEVLRNHTWDGRNFRTGPTGEEPDPLTSRGKWGGLPAYPQWWTWYSHLYVDAVEPYLRGTFEKRPTGVFHAWTNEPSDRDSIRQLLSEGTRNWIAPELSPTYDKHGHVLQEAPTMPHRLTEALLKDPHAIG